MVGISQKQLESFSEVCRKHGLKVTQQRLEIYQVLVESDAHPTAEALHRMLQKDMPTLSLDTVYRTLATFEDIGLVRRVETVTSQARFEITRERHHHFFCDRCGRLSDFHWPGFDSMDLPGELKNLGRIREGNVIVRGTCQACLEKE